MVERLAAGIGAIVVALVLIRAIHAVRYPDYRQDRRWWL